MEIVIVGLELLRRMLSRVGPYLAVEIMLPGGTLLALLLYLYRRQAGLKDSTVRMSIRHPVKRLSGDAGGSRAGRF